VRLLSHDDAEKEKGEPRGSPRGTPTPPQTDTLRQQHLDFIYGALGNGATLDPATLRDIILVSPDDSGPLHLYLAGVGAGRGTSFHGSALLDSPGTARTICPLSAVAELPHVRWLGTRATVTGNGVSCSGVEAEVTLSVAVAVGPGINHNHWELCGGSLRIIAVTDEEFARLVGTARPDCVALLGADWARHPAFSRAASALLAAYHDANAPRAATHVLRSALINHDNVRGSNQLPERVLLAPLHEVPTDAPGHLPLRHGDRASSGPHVADFLPNAAVSAPDARGEGADASGPPAPTATAPPSTAAERASLLRGAPPHKVAGFRAHRPRAGRSRPSSGAGSDAEDEDSEPLAEPLHGFAPLAEQGPNLVPMTTNWKSADEMWDDVSKVATVGECSPETLDALKRVLWERRAAFSAMAPRRADTIRLRLKPGARPTRDGLLRTQTIAQRAETLRALEEFAKLGVAEEVRDVAHIERLNILPVVLVQKPLAKGGGWRFCLDLRSLNKQLLDTAETQLPVVAEVVQAFQQCSMFSIFDETKSFNQSRLSDESADWVAAAVIDPVSGTRRFFRFHGAQLGLKPLSYLIQEAGERVTGAVMARHPSTRAGLFIDDYSLGTWRRENESRQEQELAHLAAIDHLLEQQIARGRVFGLKGSQLFVKEAAILGCLVTHDSVRLDPARTSGWTQLAVPDVPTLKWARSFLGALLYAAPFLGPTWQRDSSVLWDLVGAAERHEGQARATGDKTAARHAQRFMGQWTEAHTQAANRCIELVRGQATITFWDPAAPSWVTSDASDTGFCAYLSQARPDGSLGVVAILSRRFTPNQRLWSVGARELYALLEFMRKHGHLVAFAKTVHYCTDHLNLLSMLDLENSYVRRWCAELMQFPSFQQLVHLPGRCNSLADYLSRWCSAESDYAATPASEETPWLRARRSGSAMHRTSAALPTAPTPSVHVRALQSGGGGGGGGAPTTAPERALRARRAAPSTDLADVESAFFKNPHSSKYSPLVESILEAQWGLSEEEIAELKDERGVEEGTLDGFQALFFRGRLVIPPQCTKLVASVLSLLHDEALHQKQRKMVDSLYAAKLYLPNMNDVIRHYVETCPDCQREAAPDAAPADRPHLHRLLIRPRAHPWREVFMDYAKLPDSHDGHDRLILVSDAATRVCMLIPVASEDGATSARALQAWCHHHPPPRTVHSDGGPAFRGTDWTDACAKMGITIDTGTAYNSRGRGLIERLVRKVKEALRRVLAPGRPEEWIDHIGELQAMLNRMPHIGLGGASPNQVGYLAAEPFIPPFFNGRRVEDEQSVADLCEALRYLRAITEIHGEVSDITRKVAYDAVTELPPYVVGDWALVWFQERVSALDSFYRGPYQITQVHLDVRGQPNGFYTVAQVIGNGQLHAARTEVTAARLWPFNKERTSHDEEHHKRLPSGHGLVKEILGHRLHALGAQVRVRWYLVKQPVWEYIPAMRHKHHGWNHVYKAYCEAHNLPLEGGPHWADAVPAASGGGTGAPQVRPAHGNVLRDGAPGEETSSEATAKVNVSQLRKGSAPTHREATSAEVTSDAAAPGVRHTSRATRAGPSGSQSGDAPPAPAKGSDESAQPVRRSSRR